MAKTKPSTNWNFSALFKSDNDPRIEAAKKQVEAESYKFINKWNPSTGSGQDYRDDYLNDPKILKQALDEYEHWDRNYNTDGDFGYYFWLRASQDQSDSKIKAINNQIQDFSTKISNDIQFFELRLAKVEPKIQELFLADDNLKDYTHFLENLFAQAKYLLSEAEEKVINLYSPMASSNWAKMRSTFIAKATRKTLSEDGKVAEKSFEEIMSLLDSKQKKVRDAAAKAINSILAEFTEVAEAELNSILQTKKVNDELRGFKRPDAARHLSDDIDTKVVDALLAAVSGEFEIAKRYYRLKAKLLKVKKLKYHERNVEYGEINQKVKYPEAVAMVRNSLFKLDSELAEIFDSFVANGQIDVFPAKAKSGGAFCAHNLISQPTYILLNYTDNLRDISTLAHEVGHGINNELIRNKQNALNFGTPMATAEVASTFMEDFAMAELTTEVDPQTQLALNMGKLNDEISTIFRQVACYLFEQELHSEFRKAGYLAKEQIGKLFLKHMSAYMGDAVEQSTGSENWWVYWSHIRSSFYVYSYASGLLISKALQNSVRQDHKFIAKVKEFLSAGRSASPSEIFQKLDIDIADRNFWSNGLAEVDRLLTDTEELAQKLHKI